MTMTKHNWCSYCCIFKIVCTISVVGLAFFLQFTRRYDKQHATYTYTELTSTRDEYGRLLSRNASNSSLAEAVVAMDTNTNPVVIFNVLPKSGSRTLYAIVEKLKEQKRMDVRHTMGGDDETADDKVAVIRRTLRHSKDAAFIYTHRRYQPFGKDKKPLYISIVRDPIERLSSLYYFVRYGDNRQNLSVPSVQFRAKMEARNYSKESFNDCVLNGGRMCRRRGLVVRHFCGYSAVDCGDGSSTTAVKKAIANINRSYHVIGIMEDYLSILKVLEKKIPEIFEGAVSLYQRERKDIVSTMRTNNKTKISPKARNILRKELTQDYELYNLLKEKFKALKEELSIT